MTRSRLVTAPDKPPEFPPLYGTHPTVVDPGARMTEARIDNWGRVTGVWLPGRDKASQTPSIQYGYQRFWGGMGTEIYTSTLTTDGTGYVWSLETFDANGRPRQTQSPTPYRNGVDVKDTRYNSVGLPALIDEYSFTYDDYYQMDCFEPGECYFVEPADRADIPRSHRFTYDHAGRITQDSLYAQELYQWSTTTSYGGDRTSVTPPAGGTPVTTVNDIQGRVTHKIEHLGTTTSAPGEITSYSYDPAGHLTHVSDPLGNTWDYTWDLQSNLISVDDPDKGLSSATYDLVGNKTSTTDSRGVTINHTYDALDREVSVTTSTGAPLSQTTWDTLTKGLPTSQTIYAHGGAFTKSVDSYDSGGHPTQVTMSIPTIAGIIDPSLAGTYTTSYTYNPNGSLATETLPALGSLGSETLTYGYTPAGLPDSLTGVIGGVSTDYVASTSYGYGGLLDQYTTGQYGLEVYTITEQRDPISLLLSEISVTNTSGTLNGSTSLTYDPAGNLIEALDQWSGSATGPLTDRQCYTHDYQQQLIDAWTPTSSCSNAPSQGGLGGPAPYWTSWSVDTIGRILSRTDRTTSTTSTTTLTYPSAGPSSVQPHSVTSAVTTGSATVSRSYGYDSTGNMTSRPGPSSAQHSMIWDDLGHLSQTQDTSGIIARMVYDMVGNRIARQENTTTTLYLGGGELTLTGSSLTALRYYTHQGHTVAMRTGNLTSTVSTLVSDWQGTTHAQISHATGAVTINYQDPYGNPRGRTGSTWSGQRGFVGGTIDATGLTRIGARDYDPWLGAFITTDPIHQTSSALHLNAYRYAFNNPTTHMDPTGLFTANKFWITPTPVYGPGSTDLRSHHLEAPAIWLKAPPPPTPAPDTNHSRGTGISTKTSEHIFWEQVNAILMMSDPDLAEANLAASLRLGEQAHAWAERKGMTCYWDYVNSVNMCYGGKPASKYTGALTLGNTILWWTDTAPRNFPPSSRLLVEHEVTHTLQYSAFGPDFYFMAWGDFALYSYLKTGNVGCDNPVELGAGSAGTSYANC